MSTEKSSGTEELVTQDTKVIPIDTKPAKKTVKAAPAKKAPAKKAPAKKIAKPAKKAVKAVRTADNSNRDFGRLRVNGETLPKGRAVLSVVSNYVEKHPKITLASLQEKFPDELQKNWGMIRDLAQARKISGDKKKRFFINDKDVLIVGGKKVVVCNQWDSNNIKPFIKLAKALGYNMTAAR